VRAHRCLRWTLSSVCTTLAVISCSETVPSPQPILLGQTVCVRCHHVIQSLDAAAEAVYPDAPPRFYDDLGCLATDPAADRSGAQFYVQQAGGKGWVRVQDITFASPPGTHTPQGYNYLAYPEEEARNLAPDHWARGWDDLRRELLRKR
jgi:hypothetical protein